jgi:hypothetical protein
MAHIGVWIKHIIIHPAIGEENGCLINRPNRAQWLNSPSHLS